MQATTPTASSGSRLAIRLDALSREELLQLAAEALAELPVRHHLHPRTDALVCRRKPLPTWCVAGVLLSPDLLPHLLDHLSLEDCEAAGACSMWASEWIVLLRRRRYIQPVPKRIDVRHIVQNPISATVLSDATLCFTSNNGMHFMNAQYEVMPEDHAFAALDNLHTFRYPVRVLQHGDALLMLFVDVDLSTGLVRRLRILDGVELARSPALESPVDFAAAGDLLFVISRQKISILDVHTLEVRNTIEEDFEDAHGCAIHADELYVVDASVRGWFFVHNFDGECLRMVSPGWPPEHRHAIRRLGSPFGNPKGICIHDDRIYLIEKNDFELLDDSDTDFNPHTGRRLLVLELDGKIVQEIRIPDCLPRKGGEFTSVSFLRDELLLVDRAQGVLHELRMF